MVYPVQSLGLHGITGYPVSVECDLSGGLPAFTIVGLPDAAVNEARERVRSAVKNCGFTFPVSRITVNLAPAHVKKIGTLYDLPILVGLLAAGGQLRLREESCAFLGELSLSGQLRPCAGMLPMALAARDLGVRKLFVPRENAAEATLAGGPEIYPVADVPQLVRHFTGEEPISPAPRWEGAWEPEPGPDFAQVKGQAPVKRALEIAAAGSHNILMVGPPGSGKSMLAKRLPSILPDMSPEEALEAMHRRKNRNKTLVREFLEERRMPPELRMDAEAAVVGRLDLTIQAARPQKVVSLPMDKEFRGELAASRKKKAEAGDEFLTAKAESALTKLRAMNG